MRKQESDRINVYEDKRNIRGPFLQRNKHDITGGQKIGCRTFKSVLLSLVQITGIPVKNFAFITIISLPWISQTSPHPGINIGSSSIKGGMDIPPWLNPQSLVCRYRMHRL
jgi:hypothetical protein